MVSQNESLTKDQANIAGYRQNLVYQADALVYGDVTISFSAMEVHRGGQPVALTRKEFKTLAYLLQNARRVISRDELLNEVWGYGCYPSTRTVDNHILRLRKKLEPEPARPKHFRTVRGMGYKFLVLIAACTNLFKGRPPNNPAALGRADSDHQSYREICVFASRR